MREFRVWLLYKCIAAGFAPYSGLLRTQLLSSSVFESGYRDWFTDITGFSRLWGMVCMGIEMCSEYQAVLHGMGSRLSLC